MAWSIISGVMRCTVCKIASAAYPREIPATMMPDELEPDQRSRRV